jgi:hypothetical protein
MIDDDFTLDEKADYERKTADDKDLASLIEEFAHDEDRFSTDEEDRCSIFYYKEPTKCC